MASAMQLLSLLFTTLCSHAYAISDIDLIQLGGNDYPYSNGDTAWVLVSTALVFVMIPGVCIMFGGMIRAKNVLSVMIQGMYALATVTLLWVTVGYTLAFAPGDFIGDFRWGGLTGVNVNGNQEDSRPIVCPKTIPVLAFMVFQMAFATLTPVLIGGSIAGRMKIKFWVLFVAFWHIFVYVFVAKWIFGYGWLAQRGGLDFAGGLVVHITSGSTALVLCLIFGRCKGWPETKPRPHSLPLSLLGLCLVWMGWFGFNAGSALAADYIAVQAFVNTFIAASSSCMGWWSIEYLYTRRITAMGAIGGTLSGLVGITPCVGFVSGLSSIAIGYSTGLICYFAVILKEKLRIDDSVDTVGVHFIGGVWGSLMLGFFADASFNPNVDFSKTGNNGIFFGGSGHLLGEQALSILCVTAWSTVVTLIIVLIFTKVFKIIIRVPEADEDTGLDWAIHREYAYHELMSKSVDTYELGKVANPSNGLE